MNFDGNHFTDYDSCTLCPRNCMARRSAGQTGACGVTAGLKLARAALHFWEEPCISGTNGSGAVFFSGCSLHCVYCQNQAIAAGECGKEIPPGRLAEIFLELQEKGANNINLVTPGQYLPHIIYALERAKREGLVLPVVYNTGGYEKVDQLKRLEGLVDVWLPDFKYMDPVRAERYSAAPWYPRTVQRALAEMVRQQPEAEFYPEAGSGRESVLLADAKGVFEKEAEDGYLIRRGVIVRQLLLPEGLEDARHILDHLSAAYGDRIFVSLMSQYTPLPHAASFPELGRRVTEEEYESYVDYAISLGVEHGFIQEGDVAEESFIPAFDLEGV